MKILFIGDISAKPGRLVLKDYLCKYKAEYDLIIANCENAAHGLGATKNIIEELVSYGVDVFTSGNDIYKQQEFIEYLSSESSLVIRPLNYPDYYPGIGYKIISMKGKTFLLVNLIGRTFMKDECLNPFVTIDNFLKRKEIAKGNYDGILVDFHAEASAEKVTMGMFLDGRVSAIVGTHTHIQTSDNRILAGGSAYITDVGMSGARDAVLWSSYKSSLNKSMYPYKFERFVVEESKPWEMMAVTIDIEGMHSAKSIERIDYILN